MPRSLKRALPGLLLAALLLAMPALALAEVTGKRPQVIDGHSINLAGWRIRLFGIYAPALEQTCEAQGKTWRCGLEARWAVADRIGHNWVSCQERSIDPDGALAAVCYLGGIGGPNLNAWLVANGWALAYRPESDDYVAQEEGARHAGRGLWRGEFVAPWLWRPGL